MTKLEPFVHVKSHNPRNQLSQTEEGGESYNFLGYWGLLREVVGEPGRAVSASISCSNISTQTMSRAKSSPTLHRGKSE